MKRIISLFTIVLILLTMTVSQLTLAAAPQIVKSEDLIKLGVSTNLTGWEEILSTRFAPKIDSVANRALFFTVKPSFDSQTGILKIPQLTNNYFDIRTDTTSRDPSSPAIVYSEGMFEVKGDIKIDSGAKLFIGRLGSNPDTNNYDYYGLDAIFTEINDNTDKWYNFTITVDLDGNKVSTKFISLDSIGATPVTASKEYTRDLGIMRMTANIPAGKYIYIKNLTTSYIKPSPTYDLSSILSVGSDGMVEKEQNLLSFRMDNKIPGLKAEHITVTDSNNNVINATDITIASAGSNIGSDAQEDVIVTAELASSLPGWSDYTLHIDKACYAGFKQIDGTSYKDIEAMSADFKTFAGDFAARASCVLSDGGTKVEYTVDVANKLYDNLPLTLMLAIYNSGDEMSHLSSYTIANSYRADGSTISKALSAPIAAGQRAELFVINGWSGMRPLFGKSWKTTYTELTNP